MHEMLQLARMVVFRFSMCRYVYQEYISTRGKMKRGKRKRAFPIVPLLCLWLFLLSLLKNSLP